jgi:pyruvate formate-lyase/glycerol dehydratase family glycyl radical enzyme
LSSYPKKVNNIDLNITGRIKSLRDKTVLAERYLSTEQAAIITRVYRNNEGMTVPVKRALSLAASLDEIAISIDPEELIVGNRTSGIRAGVVFPEAGISWLDKEISTLNTREQDPFNVRQLDIEFFFREISSFWKDKTLEDNIYGLYGKELKEIEKVVKINQKDHAQGHICPDVETWLKLGPAGLLEKTRKEIAKRQFKNVEFLNCVSIALEASVRFIKRYASLADEMAEKDEYSYYAENLRAISRICNKISDQSPSTFREAVQSVWFLFVILQMESNASSFSPGRLDQILYNFYLDDIKNKIENDESVLEIIDALFIKFNQIVYMRNGHSARYFAGFPTGFNITIGGVKHDGTDAVNDLSYLFLKAQEHIRLPQPNLTARIHRSTPYKYLFECSRVIGLGTGMPQIVNDESIIPSLLNSGIENYDASDYALVGCVELSTQGNFLGWSDAAMFNMVKVLELTLNNGVCFLTGKQIGLKTGSLNDYGTFEEFENAFRIQLDFFIEKMIRACETVEKFHQEYLPSAFLSSVVKNCIENSTDVTRGGAKYNYSGIQAIQVANIADSLGVLKHLVYGNKEIDRKYLLDSLRNNWNENEELRQHCLNGAPKYGNDVDWIDELGSKWIRYFAGRLKTYRNYRGGNYHMGLYTVSAHMPMGQNVGATPDGRFACSPLADGGLSPVYGRDTSGPTAVLKSVSHIPSLLAGNGSLLNLKFLPSNFTDEDLLDKFVSFLKGFCELPIHHVQFNVVTTEELKKAKADPESYRGLTIRVAGYTAYFTELSSDLQDEIIERTMY